MAGFQFGCIFISEVADIFVYALASTKVADSLARWIKSLSSKKKTHILKNCMKWERKKKRNYATQGNDIMTWNPRKSNNDEVKKFPKLSLSFLKEITSKKENVKNETNREEQHLSSNFVQISKFSGFQQQNVKGEY